MADNCIFLQSTHSTARFCTEEIIVWPQLVFALVMLVVSYALRPKPQSPSPATTDQADIPTAEEGKPIPIIFGRVLVSGPNVTWFGALQSVEIKGGGKK